MDTFDVNGVKYRLGNNPAPLKYRWAKFGDRVKEIPREQWKPTNLSRWMPPVKDQDGQGACNAYDTVSLLEACRAMAGLPPVRLSTAHLYGSINGQRDQGSMLEDAMAHAISYGVPPESVVPERAWQKSKWPSVDLAAAAKPYRFLEVYECKTFGEMATAIQQGFFVSLGIMWYGNYNTDAKGWIPKRGSGSPGGHAIVRSELVLHDDGVTWGLGGPNSWNTQYGVNGYMTIPEDCCSGPVGGWWAGRAVVQDSGDIPAPVA